MYLLTRLQLIFNYYSFSFCILDGTFAASVANNRITELQELLRILKHGKRGGTSGKFSDSRLLFVFSK